MQRGDIACIDREVDAGHALAGGLQQIFGGGLAAAGRLEDAAVAEQVADGGADVLVAVYRGIGVARREAGQERRRRGQLAERTREGRDERAQVEQRMRSDV